MYIDYPTIKATGYDEGDLCQLLYEMITVGIAEAVWAASNFGVSVWDRRNANASDHSGTAGGTLAKGYMKPGGINQQDLADMLYEIGYILYGSYPAYFTVGTQGRFNRHSGTSQKRVLKRVVGSNGIDMGDLAQFLYESVHAMITEVAGITTADFTVAVENRDGSAVTGSRTS